MPDLVRVYHPDTDEPFDLPVGKANNLILEKGWRKQPLDKNAEPYVTGPAVEEEIRDWRDGHWLPDADDEGEEEEGEE